MYLINRSPASSLNFKIPEELWSGERVSLDHLRRFGSVAYVHTTQDKVSPRAVKGFFMGYPEGVKGYRVWMPDEGKCIVSRNVVFHEDHVFKDAMEDKAQKKESSKKVTFNFDKVHKGTVSGGDGSDTDEASTSSESPSEQKSEVETESGTEQVEGSGSVESLSDYVLARDRGKMKLKTPAMFESGDFVAYALVCAQDMEVDEPRTVAEAMKSKYWKEWKKAMGEEIQSLIKNGTWKLVQKPIRKRMVGCKWIFKFKEGIPKVEPPRFKARLVAQGYTQVEGIDYNEIFSHVVKHVSIRLLLSIVVNFDLELEQLDVKTAFLYGNLDEEIYMNQPECFIEQGDESKVCLLKKSL